MIEVNNIDFDAKNMNTGRENKRSISDASYRNMDIMNMSFVILSLIMYIL
jgi:hypothetical protein